jgi:hypothetical protein
MRVIRVCGTVRKAAEEAIRTSREEALKGTGLMSGLELLTGSGSLDEQEETDDDEDMEENSDDN